MPVAAETALPSHILMNDIFIELMNYNWQSKKMARINCNLYFVDDNLKLTFRSDQIKVSDSANVQPFEFTMHFEYHCLCHLPVYS